MTADRRVNARSCTNRGRGSLDLVIKLVERLSHSVKPLILELAPAARQYFHRRQRVRIVGGELRIDGVTRRQHRASASDVGRVRGRLAREHGIIRQPGFLGPFDFGIPVGALHKSKRYAPIQPACKIDEPDHHRNCALLISLNNKSEPVPAFEIGRRCDPLEQVEHDFKPVGLLGIDGYGNVCRSRMANQSGERRQ